MFKWVKKIFSNIRKLFGKKGIDKADKVMIYRPRLYNCKHRVSIINKPHRERF
jgi:hypothetical protein